MRGSGVNEVVDLWNGDIAKLAWRRYCRELETGTRTHTILRTLQKCSPWQFFLTLSDLAEPDPEREMENIIVIPQTFLEAGADP
jgi:hypothetical protein